MLAMTFKITMLIAEGADMVRAASFLPALSAMVSGESSSSVTIKENQLNLSHMSEELKIISSNLLLIVVQLCAKDFYGLQHK